MQKRKIQLLAGERHKRETYRAVEACNDYLRMGPGRSVRALHRHYCKTSQNLAPTLSYATMQEWSARYGWLERAEAYDAEAEDEKNERRRQEMESGLALDYKRVHELKDIVGLLLDQLYQQDQDGTYHNLWLPDVKQIGGGEYAERVDIVRFNAAIIDQLRGVLDDLAKETGGRVRRQEISGLLKNVDMSKLTIEQLERIADGDDPIDVLASSVTGTG